MVSDIYLWYINILMDTKFLFFFVSRKALPHIIQGSPKNTTLVSTPVCPQQKHSALYHLTAINIP